jgi:hypothetical protein
MIDLPAPALLANMVSETTQMMFGISLVFGGDCPPGLPDVGDGHTIIVPLIGDPLYLVTAKSSAVGGLALATMMFECAPGEANAAMIEDSLRELTNILAGQLKSFIAQEHQIGLPSRLEDDTTLAGSSRWAGARLQIGAQAAEVDVAVAEYATAD